MYTKSKDKYIYIKEQHEQYAGFSIPQTFMLCKIKKMCNFDY